MIETHLSQIEAEVLAAVPSREWERDQRCRLARVRAVLDKLAAARREKEKWFGERHDAAGRPA